MSAPLLLAALSLPAAFLIYTFLPGSSPPRPPGPTPYPLVGNLPSLLPLSTPLFLHLARLASVHGPTMFLQLGPIRVVVLSSAKAQADVLDRMGGKTSGRPRLVMAGELMTRRLLYVFMNYGERWRKLRRWTHEGFNIRACEAYYPFQTSEASNLVLSLLPSSFPGPATQSQSQTQTKPNPRAPFDVPAPLLPERLKYASAAVTWRSLYSGPSLSPSDEARVQAVDKIGDDVLRASQPLANLVDVLPFLELLPGWVAPWKRKGERWFEETDKFFRQVMEAGKKVEKADHAKGFIASTAPNFERLQVTEQEAAWTAGGLFGAGVETTSAALHFFVLAMVLHPSVTQRAQAELASVCGSRPPSFSDRDNLPYIQAMVKEVLRWRPVAPLGMPHVAEEEVEYEGWRIGRGTLLMGNIWAISHDPAFFPDPHKFDPTRFLSPSGTALINPSVLPDYHDLTVGYGSGRRICPGRDFANNTLFIDIAFLLWAFDIAPAKDAQGREILPDSEGYDLHGLMLHPAPFACTLTPRRDDLREMLMLTA